MSLSPEKTRNDRVDLDTLHRELVDARNLAIKTDNLVKNLSADIKQISRYQATYQRRAVFNTAIVYVVFLAVAFTGIYLSFNTRLQSAHREIEHYQVQNQTLMDNLDEVEAEIQRRRDAENRAYAFYQLLESGDWDEVVEQFAQLRAQLADRTMIELLQDRVDEINYTLAESSYRDGMSQVRSQRWADARDAFLTSVNHVERAPWTPVLQFNLALALFELEDYEGALFYFDQALASQDLDEAYQGDASYRRAMCLENTGRLAEAQEAYTRFRQNHPVHRFAGRALHALNRLQRDFERAQPEQ